MAALKKRLDKWAGVLERFVQSKGDQRALVEAIVESCETYEPLIEVIPRPCPSLLTPRASSPLTSSSLTSSLLDPRPYPISHIPYPISPITPPSLITHTQTFRLSSIRPSPSQRSSHAIFTRGLHTRSSHAIFTRDQVFEHVLKLLYDRDEDILAEEPILQVFACVHMRCTQTNTHARTHARTHKPTRMQ